MSCATKAYASPLVMPAPQLVSGKFVAGLVLLVEAFQEALELRRIAFKDRPILDE
jgi:hypothetical protein